MITIREEQPEDVRGIFAVHAASFPTLAEAELVEKLRVAGRLRVSLVAVDGDDVVGHVAFSPVTLEGAPEGLGLAPLAVRGDHRRRGIGASLVREGLARCETVGFVVVLGEPRYYGRFGFEPASKWRLRDEFHGGDAFRALELVHGSIPVAGGLVRYSAEFAALGE